MSGRNDIAINWERVKEKISQRGWAQQDFARIMGKGVGWVTDSSRRDTHMDEQGLEQMALVLGCEKAELMREETQESKNSVPEEFKQSQFELDTMAYFRKITSELSAMKEILMYLFNEKQQSHEDGESRKQAREDELETAVKTLKELMENRQAIKYDDYIKAARKNNVLNGKIADAAVAKLGFHKKATGYGNNKKLWIYKEVQL